MPPDSSWGPTLENSSEAKTNVDRAGSPTQTETGGRRGCCDSGARTGTDSTEVRYLAPPVHVWKCPWARHSTPNCSQWSGDHGSSLISCEKMWNCKKKIYWVVYFTYQRKKIGLRFFICYLSVPVKPSLAMKINLWSPVPSTMLIKYVNIWKGRSHKYM